MMGRKGCEQTHSLPPCDDDNETKLSKFQRVYKTTVYKGVGSGGTGKSALPTQSGQERPPVAGRKNFGFHQSVS